MGAHIEVYSRAFELTDADEYTLTYMENNKHIFIMADADALIKTTKAQIRWAGRPCLIWLCQCLALLLLAVTDSVACKLAQRLRRTMASCQHG